MLSVGEKGHFKLAGATREALVDIVTKNLTATKALLTTVVVTHEQFMTSAFLMNLLVTKYAPITPILILSFHNATESGNKDKHCCIIFALKQWWKFNLGNSSFCSPVKAVDVFKSDSAVVKELLGFFEVLKSNPDFKSWHQMLCNWWNSMLCLPHTVIFQLRSMKTNTIHRRRL